jgi:hypothetical protein
VQRHGQCGLGAMPRLLEPSPRTATDVEGKSKTANPEAGLAARRLAHPPRGKKESFARAPISSQGRLSCTFIVTRCATASWSRASDTSSECCAARSLGSDGAARDDDIYSTTWQTTMPRKLSGIFFRHTRKCFKSDKPAS